MPGAAWLAAQPLIWDAGPDMAFWVNPAALLILVALTVSAYTALAQTTRKTRASWRCLPSS